jgi:hypothetical protein
MRMIHYFGGFAVFLVLALLLAAYTGFSGRESHLISGLICAVAAIGTHSLLILFMIVTGRVLREAVRVRNLSPSILDELNSFFAQHRAYPAAIFSCFLITTAAVLGYGHHSFGLHPSIHMLVACGALIYNLYALKIELRAIAANQRLIDRATLELDAADARGEGPVNEPSPGIISPMPWGPTLAIGAWLPYVYWSLFTWRGDFSKVSIHPWAELSACGLILIFLSVRRGR